MKDNKRNAANTAKHAYLLSGLIECGQCGGTYFGKTNKSGKGYITRSYACSNKYRSKTCNAQNINADELEAAVVMKIKQYFSGGDFEAMADEIFKAYEKSKGSKSDEKKELAQIERKLANGAKAILEGADFPELNEAIAHLRVHKAELEDILAISPDLVITKRRLQPN